MPSWYSTKTAQIKSQLKVCYREKQEVVEVASSAAAYLALATKLVKERTILQAQRDCPRFSSNMCTYIIQKPQQAERKETELTSGWKFSSVGHNSLLTNDSTSEVVQKWSLLVTLSLNHMPTTC